MSDHEQLPLTLADGPTGPTDQPGQPADPPAPSAADPVPVPARAERSFQASAGIQGRQFAEQCDTLLTHLGYELRGRRVLTEVGVEIDQEAVSPSGRIIWTSA